ncbi:DUF1699 family protein [Candidatus Micrarchaeota archaeon]|nr:DUF1699 family protein [Candidatus Micrarchaeota archaeon]
MKFINAKSKRDLLEQINSLERNEPEVYVSLRPTMEITHRIVEQCPNVKRIICPQSLYLQVSKKVFKYLQSKSIEIKSGDIRVGRPMKHDAEVIKQVLNQRAAGKPAKQISQEFDVPLRTVYFYLKNGLTEE